MVAAPVPPGCRHTELASFHSITSSARASNIGGMVGLSAWAVLRLIANSNFVGACTGSSLGSNPSQNAIHIGCGAMEQIDVRCAYESRPPSFASSRVGYTMGTRWAGACRVTVARCTNRKESVTRPACVETPLEWMLSCWFGRNLDGKSEKRGPIGLDVPPSLLAAADEVIE